MKGSITIQNHTDETILVESSKADPIEIEKYTIPPNDYFVFFTDRFVSLRCDKHNETTI